ncbi:uncharacterized protein ARMOST_03200 [Armillaria ostoyae]|uniref:Integrase catalytic domain-containing protein n=1 Tax=Armillaria ostoyae TaxID=47428 RepID=A0A284QTW5_ARMOS|nr:uncharacterized protein ARMOST_03200 [Armillaria ostoyae]
MPTTVISDRGPQFVSKFMKELYQMLDITQNASTAFHPQTDGQMKRVNQEVKKYLCIFINHRQDDWADWLPLVEFTYNNQVHSATGKSLFMVMYGRNPHVIPDSPRSSPFSVPTTNNFADAMTQIHKEVQNTMEASNEKMKAQYDKHKRNSVMYQIGEHV